MYTDAVEAAETEAPAEAPVADAADAEGGAEPATDTAAAESADVPAGMVDKSSSHEKSGICYTTSITIPCHSCVKIQNVTNLNYLT